MKITHAQLNKIIREAIFGDRHLNIGDNLKVAPSNIHGNGVFVTMYIPAETDLGIAQVKKQDGTYNMNNPCCGRPA